jgi:hypothetical protein
MMSRLQTISDIMSRLQTIQQDLESQRPAIGMLLELYRAVANTGQSVLSVSTCRCITESPVFGNTRSDYVLIGKLVANDTKVSRDTLVQLFAFPRQA